MNPSSTIRTKILNDLGVEEKKIKNMSEPVLEIAGSTQTCINMPKPLPIPVQKTKLKEDVDKTYIYELDFLNKGRPEVSNSKINLCLYSVTTEAYYPFLQFLLYKNKDKFYWPFFKAKKELKMLPEEKLDEFGIENISYYQGYLQGDDNEFYLFYKLVDNTPSLELQFSKDQFWFGLVSEICQSRSIVDCHVDKSVYGLFERNPCLGFIKNKGGQIFENPIGLYKGVSSNRLDWIASFGVIKGSIFATMGPFYYLSDFQTAGRFGSWTVNFQPSRQKGITDNKYGRYVKGGVVRFAIFLGKLNVLLTREDDNITVNAVIKKQKDKFKERNIEMVPKEAIKFTDNLGLWVKKYDSIYLGDVDLNIDSYQKYLFIGASYVVKNYFQQFPISYHYLDKKKIGSMYDKKSSFNIE